MNTTTVTNAVLALGLDAANFRVKAERTGSQKFFTITLLSEADYLRAEEVSASVFDLLKKRGVAGGVEVFGSFGRSGDKLA